jgi:hypothetical protein
VQNLNPSLVASSVQALPASPVFYGAGEAAAAFERQAQRAESGAAAGLVQSKTSPNQTIEIDLSPSEKAKRRIKKLKRSVYLAGQLHSMSKAGHRPPVPWLITLTYDTRGTLGRGAHQWCADHMSKASDAYRRWCQRYGYTAKYTWVCELQGNGTPHYHLVAWLPHGVNMPKWDKPRRQRKAFWSHGMTETARLKSNVGYLMKYLSKMGEFHRFPKGLRLHGNGGLELDARQIRTWHNMPEWVKNEYGVGEVKRMRGGLVDMETGEMLPPAYRVAFTRDTLTVTRLRETAPRAHDGPYCTLNPRP